MDIKAVLAVAAVVLLSIIGINYYNSHKAEQRIAERKAETEATKAVLSQSATPPKTEPAARANTDKSKPATRIMSDDELAAANQAVIDAANQQRLEASNSEHAASIDASKKQICDSIITFSESAMQARLAGVSIQSFLARLDSANDGSDAAVKINKMYTAIAMDAYRKPNYSTREYREEAVREFALANYLACTDAVAKW